MNVCHTIADLRKVVAAARAAGRTIGCVPTMGALHAGHISLVDACKTDGHFIVATVFVNPTQFGPGEDFEKYPRTLDADLAACRAAGVDAVFAPSTDEMYPRPGETTVHVATLTETLCGAFRPGHFDGVCTVVTKLLNIVQPDAAYFGQKDAQQVIVIRRMVEDLNMPTRIVTCPTVREPDGLAMSSRNRNLSPAERQQARSLSAALHQAAEAIRAGQTDGDTIRQVLQETISAGAPDGRVDYAEVVDAETLQPVERIDGAVLLAVAVRFSHARLIDNVAVDAGQRNP